MLLSMIGINVLAYDFSADSSDGITFYYNIIKKNTEVEVAPCGHSYSGVVMIPEKVAYNGIIYNVTSIGRDAFRRCNITSVTIPNSVTKIEAYAFAECENLKSVIIGNSVTTIGEGAFWVCTGLTAVTIPNSVVTIGDGAFQESGLISVTIPNSVTSINNYAFLYCHSLISVTIPNSVTSIGEYAFCECYGLTSVIIPNSVVYIGRSAFEDCNGLTSVTIPNSDIEVDAFKECTRLTSLNIGDASTVNDGCSLLSIEKGAFSYCKSMTSVSIGNNVKEIKDRAFYNCSQIMSLTLGSNVNYIGPGAFSGCISLTSVTSLNTTPPHKLASFDKRHDPFDDSVYNTATLYVPKGYKFAYSQEFWIKFANIEENDTLINSILEIDGMCYYVTSSSNQTVGVAPNERGYCGDVIIPRTVDYNKTQYKVTSIGSNAFCDCIDLTSIFIPNGITSIGKWAFENCFALTSVNLPNTVTSIGFWAFGGCRNLTSITLGNGLIDIGDYAFSSCSSLTSITIPNNVSYISRKAFNECTGLSTVIIHCKDVGGCFESMSSIKELILGHEVTKISDYAFYRCDGLTKITSMIMEPFEIKNNIFSDINDCIYKNATLYVPEGTINKYKATPSWNKFQFIVENETSIIDNKKINSFCDNTSVYTLQGVKLPKNANDSRKYPKGIYIIDGKKIVIK